MTTRFARWSFATDSASRHRAAGVINQCEAQRESNDG
jgi:hypothetical protein